MRREGRGGETGRERGGRGAHGGPAPLTGPRGQVQREDPGGAGPVPSPELHQPQAGCRPAASHSPRGLRRGRAAPGTERGTKVVHTSLSSTPTRSDSSRHCYAHPVHAGAPSPWSPAVILSGDPLRPGGGPANAPRPPCWGPPSRVRAPAFRSACRVGPVPRAARGGGSRPWPSSAGSAHSAKGPRAGDSPSEPGTLGDLDRRGAY